ncbi:MAG TPA: cytochrome c oxidase subunit I [Chloroflexota bacterium]|nr:cytochrome c oxidase subunit I [Chloroflexota bacterium]
MATTLTPPQVTAPAPTPAAPQVVAPRPVTPAYHGFTSWLTTIDHKRIGILYGTTAAVFFLVGGVEALMIRMQLAVPNNGFVSADAFNQLFTMHGTTMIFLVIMPMSVAFFNFIVPLQIGARDVAFPRLNAFSYWAFLFGALFMNMSYFVSGLPDGGWFGYAPLTTRTYSPTERIDFWLLGLQLLGVASLAGAFNFLVTIINMRCPGMSLMRMPVFSWNTLVTSFLLILAFPAITVALILLMFDRYFGTNFYYAPNGGDPLLWQHLFWIFGHPEVYILILPAMGMVSEILPVYSHKPLFGYPFVVYATVAIGFIGFGVWSHHMFTVGLGPIANSFFAASTMLIAVPTGVKIFNWLGTLWGGSIRFNTAMLFAVGFVSMFTIGGLSGVMHASVPIDLQHQDSYFVVAHFHYVLFGGSILGLFGGIYHWWPKITGRLLDEKLGRLNFWLMLIGFNITFGLMHFLGVDGMPRRIYTYSPNQGWSGWFGLDWLGWNMLITIGAFLIAVSVAVFIYNVFWSLRHGEIAGNDPWDGATLEWSIPSPPPAYNFAVEPTVRSRDAFWALKRRWQAVEVGEHHGHLTMAGMPTGEVEFEEAHSSEEAHRAPVDVSSIHMPNPSFFPLIAALGLTCMLAGFVFGFGLSIAGAIYLIVAIGGWALEPTS